MRSAKKGWGWTQHGKNCKLRHKFRLQSTRFMRSKQAQMMKNWREDLPQPGHCQQLAGGGPGGRGCPFWQLSGPQSGRICWLRGWGPLPWSQQPAEDCRQLRWQWDGWSQLWPSADSSHPHTSDPANVHQHHHASWAVPFDEERPFQIVQKSLWICNRACAQGWVWRLEGAWPWSKENVLWKREWRGYQIAQVLARLTTQLIWRSSKALKSVWTISALPLRAAIYRGASALLFPVLRMAPDCAKKSTGLLLPASQAKKRGVAPLLSLISMFAPSLTAICRMTQWLELKIFKFPPLPLYCKTLYVCNGLLWQRKQTNYQQLYACLQPAPPR